MKIRTWVVCVGVAAMLAGGAQAGFVTVGNPGNADDTHGDGYGGVAYEYRISQYEVTAGQWRDFLNAVDSTGVNDLGLYNSFMNSNQYGCQITWNDETNTYDFSGRPSGTEADWTERPVNYVSWYDAARYTNWLTTGNTESGVYNTSTWESLDHPTAPAALGVTTAYFIPTEDEWYKAAYYDPSLNGGSGGYYDYPTGSDTVPSNALINPDPGNNATFRAETVYTIGPDYYRTEVGAHANSGSPYGTFDQGGNLWEWNETLITASSRGRRGGSFYDAGNHLGADFRSLSDPTGENNLTGFRVASIVVPEPGTLGLLLLGTAGLLVRRKRLAR